MAADLFKRSNTMKVLRTVPQQIIDLT